MFGLNHLIEANTPEGVDPDDETDDAATAHAPA
jgi:hypothetical protein